MAKGHNPRRAKIHRSYTVAEAAVLFAVHRNTVRNWIKRGLPVLRADSISLILGADLRRFLEKDAAGRKRKCQPGQLYCLRCREPRTPASGTARIVPGDGRSANIGAICGCCGARMFRRISLRELEAAAFSCTAIQA